MPAPVAWTLDHLTADEVAVPAMRRTIVGLYAEVYAEPPYLRGPDDTRLWDDEVLPRHLANPGFALVFARHGGTPMGFALGTALQPDTRWWSGMVDPLPARMTREDGAQTFAVYEFVVRKPYRRTGLGRAMHRALVGPWTGPRTTLTLRPSAPAAVAFWAAQGYRAVGFSRPDPAGPLYTMMLRDHEPPR
ncbi:GNAT family N-acetyltransferase [Yinghuangia seranimata]|uniref:GNAT family N-acetyltransferase n=1 Tax=Yinghuangia seranimata TaxID=408067 RepID=UPI00248D2AFE|nr:GNAT family N-acetyltransferase [Yinghuangia seranimata]MDI2125709.1 GNAT family N-acetyltransferase [Yinghuangia seranimata]